jgi:hypothetical protein
MAYQMRSVRVLVMAALWLAWTVAALAAREVPDLNLIQPGAQGWFYRAVNDRAKGGESFMAISRDVQGGRLRLGFGDSLDAIVERGRFVADAKGRLAEAQLEVDSKLSRLSCDYTPTGVRVSTTGDGTDSKRDIVTDRPVFDFLSLMFFAGACRLGPGEEQALKAVVASKDGLLDFDIYVRLLREESLTSLGHSFRAQVLEVGAQGILGLAVPKMQVWVDMASRLPLRMESGGKLAFELVRIGS